MIRTEDSCLKERQIKPFVSHVKESKVLYRENLRRLWDREYSEGLTIPSSRRVEPAHALVELERNFNIRGQKALDLGCGNGRNAFYLAKKGMSVKALDFSKAALEVLRELDSNQEYSGEVESINYDIYDGLPFAESSFDLILDSYCLCHFVDPDENLQAMKECERVLKPGGHLIKIHLDNQDTYYLERIYEETNFGYISVDPVNGIKKMHCSIDSYCRYFANNFNVEISKEINFIDAVRGRDYERSVFVSLLRKT